MKRLIPLLAVLAGVAFVVSTLFSPAKPTGFDLAAFSRLPVLANGRLKPIDTLARSSLLQMQSRQAVYLHDGTELTPQEWLADVAFNPDKADTYPTFTIDNPDLLSLIGKNDDNLTIVYPDKARQILATLEFIPSRYRRFSYAEIAPYLAKIDQQAKLADQVDQSQRNHFQTSVLQLDASLAQYDRLKNSFTLPGSADPLGELLTFEKNIKSGRDAVKAKLAKQPFDEALAESTLAIGRRFIDMDQKTNIMVIPPANGSKDINGWETAGHSLVRSFDTDHVDFAAAAYAGLAYSWNKHDPEHFNGLLVRYQKELTTQLGTALSKTDAEVRFNAAQPFYTSLLIYITAFLIAIASWLIWPDLLGKSAYYLVGLAWLVATSGLVCRIWMEGRPPVTNLYSSALFVGWGAVGLCLILEPIFKNAIATAAAGMVGFSTLMIAQMLSLSGDTMEMMRAVLDSNFWLGTHVVVVTIGYASTFLAGFLAILYVLRGLFTRSLDEATANATAKMVYGIVCFATLFSFVGTVLGGIWADQSWGRFWGWDPKENGALIIVIWNALILHARWGGMVRTRGLMALAIAGNIVTSWSWFGTNMLGVGLHSYGFTEAAFQWLVAFVAIQLVLIALALVPRTRWRSFASADQKA